MWDTLHKVPIFRKIPLVSCVVNKALEYGYGTCPFLFVIFVGFNVLLWNVSVKNKCGAIYGYGTGCGKVFNFLAYYFSPFLQLMLCLYVCLVYYCPYCLPPTLGGQGGNQEVA